MKAISIKQPWATLVAHGLKDIENRTWKTDYTGKILIVANSTKVPRSFWDSVPIEIYSVIVNNIIMGNIPELNSLPNSAVVGFADIKEMTSDEVESIWGGGLWQWVLENAYMFDEPQMVGIKSKAHIFDIPEIDENNLPAHHKAVIKYPVLEGNELVLPLADVMLDDLLHEEDKRIELEFFDDRLQDILCPNPETFDVVKFDVVKVETPTRTMKFKSRGCEILIRTDEEDRPIKVPSIWEDEPEDFNCFTIFLDEQI